MNDSYVTFPSRNDAEGIVFPLTNRGQRSTADFGRAVFAAALATVAPAAAGLAWVVRASCTVPTCLIEQQCENPPSSTRANRH